MARVGILAMVAALAAIAPVVGAADALHWHITTLTDTGTYSTSEPGITISPNGTALIAAATANTGPPPTIWISRDSGDTWSAGKDFDTTGASTGDADMAVGADGYLYALNLAFANPPAMPANPTVQVFSSQDGSHWNGPASFAPPHGLDQPDRPWLVPDRSNPAVVYVFNSEGGGNIVMWRSSDHAQSFAGPILVTGGANSQPGLALGSRPLIDPTDDKRLYMAYETVTQTGLLTTLSAGAPVYEFPMNQLWLAASSDGGSTWSNSPILDSANLTGALQNGTVGHLIVTSAIDPSGNLFAAFALRPSGDTKTKVYFTHSIDRGATWSAPAAITSPMASNVMPALAVSESGVAYLSWYGSTDAYFGDAQARWAEMFAMTANPLASQPTFAVQQISGDAPVHVGGINTAGTIGNDQQDNWGLRDFQSIAVDGCGRPHPTWAVDAGRQATQTAVPEIACGSVPTAAAAAAGATNLPNTGSAGSDLPLDALLWAVLLCSLPLRGRQRNRVP